MSPKALVDLGSLDLSGSVAGPEQIRECNPQRYEMEHLDGVLHMDTDVGIIVGFKDVTDDEFWLRGHVPGRPLLPGVIMCEAAAQLCSYYYHRVMGTSAFLGFAGLENVKFRRPVVPGDRLMLIGLCRELKVRRSIFDCQGLVNGRIVFEGTIIGMPI